MTDLLSPEELEELLKQVGSSQNVESILHKEVKSYDFRRPDKFSPSHMKSISIIFESFSRLFASNISSEVRTLCSMKLESVRQISQQDYIDVLPNPSVLGVVNMSPLIGNAIIEVDNKIVFILIEHMLGGVGNAQSVDINRELTSLEETVIENFIKNMLEVYTESWKQVNDIEPKFLYFSSNPKISQIIPPTEMVLLIQLELSVSGFSGYIKFCLPYSLLENVIDRLNPEYWRSYHKANSEWFNQALRQNLYNTQLEVSAQLARIKISMKEYLSLKKGEIINFFEYNTQDPIEVYIDKEKQFLATPCIKKNKLAIKITKNLLEEKKGKSIKDNLPHKLDH